MPGYNKHLPVAVATWQRGKGVGTDIDLEEGDSLWIPGKRCKGVHRTDAKEMASFRGDFPLT